MRPFSLLLLLVLSLLSAGEAARGQTFIIEGSVTDAEDGSGVEGAIVTLLSNDGKQKPLGYTVAGAGGAFRLEHGIAEGKVLLTAASLGYKSGSMEISAGSLAGVAFRLRPEATLLDEVSVKAPYVIRRSDTTSYIVDQIKLETDRSIEDLLRRIPGISIDSKGTISYAGTPISSFYIEGIDTMRERYAIATQSIHPDDVGTVSIYERHEPVRILRGETDPEAAALNITLKEGSKMRPVGYLYGAAGKGTAVPILYEADLFGLLIRKEAQYLVSGKANNSGETIRGFFDGEKQHEHPADLLTQDDPLGHPEIPASHYRRNGDAALSANAVHRTGEGDVVRFSADYLRSEEHFDQSERTEYRSGTGGQLLTMEETLTTRRRSDEAALSLDYERNRPEGYAHSVTTLSYSRGRSDYGIRRAIPERQMTEMVEEEGIALDNRSQLLFTGSLSGGLVTLRNDFYLEHRPHSDMTLSEADIPGGYLRNLSGTYLENNTGLGEDFELGSPYWKLSLEAELKLLYAALRMSEEGTSPLSLPGYQTGGAGTFGALQLSPRVALELTYRRGGSRLSAEVPLEYHYLGVLASETGDRPNKSLITSGLTLSYSYKPAPEWTLSARGGVRYDPGSPLRYYDRPALVSYRSITTLGAGTGPDLAAHYSGGAGVNYRDPLAARSGSLSLSYAYTRRELLSSQTIASDGIGTAYEREPNGARVLNAFFSFNQGFDALHSVLGITAGYNLLRRTLLRNGVPADFRLSDFVLEPDITLSLFQNLLNLNAGGSWNLTSSGIVSGDRADRAVSISARGALALSLIDHTLQVRTQFAGMWQSRDRSLQAYDFYPFLSLDLLYKFPRSRAEITLDLRNLLDSRSYRRILLTGLDYTASSAALRGREALLGVRWRF